MLRELLRMYFLISGGFFFVSTAVAMLRFKDVYARLHAASKCLTGGTLSLLLAFVLQAQEPFLIFKVILAAFFMFITNPLASHALARAAYSRGCGLEHIDVDELREDSEWEKGDER